MEGDFTRMTQDGVLYEQIRICQNKKANDFVRS